MRSRRPTILSLTALILFLGFLAAENPLFAADKEKILYTFCPSSGCKDGSNPAAALIFDAGGNLYGTTRMGGLPGCGSGNGCGTVFELTRGANGKWAETVLHSFGNGKDGSDPEASLIFDTAGNLYGTTFRGGAYGNGCVFQLTPGSNGKWNETLLHSFRGNDGANPFSSLTVDASGNLYGTAGGGRRECNNSGCGVVFELTRQASGQWTEKVLHYFGKGNDGSDPLASLIFDSYGNLYGTTVQGGTWGGGTVFEMTPAAGGKWTEKVLHSFGSGGSGIDAPYAGVTVDADGDLFGTTAFGSVAGLGTVFKLAPESKGTWTMTVLFAFNSLDGAVPRGNLVLDASGNLYGTTLSGGTDGSNGTAFRLKPDADGKWTHAVLYGFQQGGKGGYFLYAGLILGADGNLYGTTESGGNPICEDGCGVVFELTP